MGLIYANITIVSSDDLALFRQGYKNEEEIRQLEVNALVDSAAYMLAINEEVLHQLGLPIIGEKEAELADGSLVKLPIAGPMEVRFANRRTTVDAIVLPGKDTEILLGAIPLEGLDVQIDPRKQTLILPPERPYVAQVKMKKQLLKR